MRPLLTILASACATAILAGAPLSAWAQWENRDQGWYDEHHERHAERDRRWGHEHEWAPDGYAYVVPPPSYYGYYNPPPVYYVPGNAAPGLFPP